jgi:competence protein ComEC
MRRRPEVVLALTAFVVITCACRGFAPSRQDATPLPNIASSARVTESSVAKVAIDRDCSRLGDASDEYVCLTNGDTAPVDMSAWVLRNVLGRSFNFPTGFTLPVGQTVKVHTGSGTDSPTDLHWAYRVNPAWEKGDKLTLHNGEDVEVFVSEAAPH